MMRFAALAFAACLLSLTVRPVLAQEASQEEQATLAGIAQCLVAGLPPDWAQAEMHVRLPAANAATGDVTYTFRRSLSGGAFEEFRPCDVRTPARALTELRKQQPPERRGWDAARFVVHRDGKFELTYDYPKAK